MPSHLSRSTATLAVSLALGLSCLPACQKKDEPVPESGGSGEWRLSAPPVSPVFSKGGTNEARTRAVKDLKTIGAALHNYSSANGDYLPGGYADKTGKPGLSWRVAILPHLGEEALFKEFKLDEPWDSEHNRKLIDRMPAVFAPHKTETNGYTFYRGFSGQGTWLLPVWQWQKLQPGAPLHGQKIFSIPDGTSNTIFVAEAWEPVVWTKPDEIAITWAKSGTPGFAPGTEPKLFGVFGDSAVALRGDGSVVTLKKGIDQKKLAILIGTSDGLIVDWDD